MERSLREPPDMRSAAIVLVALSIAPTTATAQPAQSFRGLLTLARRAIRSGHLDEAERHLKKAIGQPAADGRAYAELASLHAAAGRSAEAMELAQRAYLRAENTWYRHGLQVRGTAAFTLGRAREAAGDIDGALSAYLHSLSLRSSPSARRRTERLSRAWWGTHQAPPPVVHRHLSTWRGEVAEESACDGFWDHVADNDAANGKLDPHRGWPHCTVVSEWSHAHTRWQLVTLGDFSFHGEYLLWVHRAGRWHEAGALGMFFSGGDSTDLRVRQRGFHRWDGRAWLVLEIEDETYDPGRCEDTITIDHATVACAFDDDGEPVCVQWSRGMRHAHSPSYWYVEPEDRPDIEGYGCPERPDGTASTSQPRFRPPARTELGPRGIRLVGDEVPPTLTRWRSPLEARQWARPEVHQWDRRLWNLGLIDHGLLERVDQAPELDARRRVRADIAEYLLPATDDG